MTNSRDRSPSKRNRMRRQSEETGGEGMGRLHRTRRSSAVPGEGARCCRVNSCSHLSWIVRRPGVSYIDWFRSCRGAQGNSRLVLRHRRSGMCGTPSAELSDPSAEQDQKGVFVCCHVRSNVDKTELDRRSRSICRACAEVEALQALTAALPRVPHVPAPESHTVPPAWLPEWL
jgi:hypothetical protein